MVCAPRPLFVCIRTRCEWEDVYAGGGVQMGLKQYNNINGVDVMHHDCNTTEHQLLFSIQHDNNSSSQAGGPDINTEVRPTNSFRLNSAQ